MPGFSEQARRWVKKFMQVSEEGLCKSLDTKLVPIGNHILDSIPMLPCSPFQALKDRAMRCSWSSLFGIDVSWKG